MDSHENYDEGSDIGDIKSVTVCFYPIVMFDTIEKLEEDEENEVESSRPREPRRFFSRDPLRPTNVCVKTTLLKDQHSQRTTFEDAFGLVSHCLSVYVKV